VAEDSKKTYSLEMLLSKFRQSTVLGLLLDHNALRDAFILCSMFTAHFAADRMIDDIGAACK